LSFVALRPTHEKKGNETIVYTNTRARVHTLYTHYILCVTYKTIFLYTLCALFFNTN